MGAILDRYITICIQITVIALVFSPAAQAMVGALDWLDIAATILTGGKIP